MIIPIFIHVRERSKEEIDADFKRDHERWRKEREEEARYRREKEEAKEKKRRDKYEEYCRQSEAYEKERAKDPWQFTFMPEGWSIFGQRSIYPISDI